eukprot:symbB.v1.2.035764.t1/scaffold4896.1/size34818/1
MISLKLNQSGKDKPWKARKQAEEEAVKKAVTQATADDWAFTNGPEHAFPLPNVSIVDVPTWMSGTDFE